MEQASIEVEPDVKELAHKAMDDITTAFADPETRDEEGYTLHDLHHDKLLLIRNAIINGGGEGANNALNEVIQAWNAWSKQNAPKELANPNKFDTVAIRNAIRGNRGKK